MPAKVINGIIQPICEYTGSWLEVDLRWCTFVWRPRWTGGFNRIGYRFGMIIRWLSWYFELGVRYMPNRWKYENGKYVRFDAR